jgi:apolipoprotein D and lipocalin family protein
MQSRILKSVLLSPLLVIMGCSSYAPMATVSSVDLKRFMGDWYVVANIPTFIEKEAYNPLENYRLEDDGTIATTFTFNDGSFDGELKTYHPKGYVLDSTTNALWGMQFIWPIKSDYRIVYLDEDYQNTIIARQARDYVWVMSRRPEISPQRYAHLKKVVEQLGYDVSRLQQPPHQPVNTEKENQL